MYVSKMAGLIVLSTLCCSGPLVSQTAGGTRASSPTATRNDHSLIKRGTVNILLANKNGLVAITDSKLVMGNDPAGYAQKLFRIDDHTLCTIAGWYSWSGPLIGGKVFPAYLSIPRVINRVAAHIAELKTFEDKQRFLVDTVRFNLRVLDQIATDSGLQRNTSPKGVSRFALLTLFLRVWGEEILSLSSLYLRLVCRMRTLHRYFPLLFFW